MRHSTEVYPGLHRAFTSWQQIWMMPWSGDLPVPRPGTRIRTCPLGFHAQTRNLTGIAAACVTLGTAGIAKLAGCTAVSSTELFRAAPSADAGEAGRALAPSASMPCNPPAAASALGSSCCLHSSLDQDELMTHHIAERSCDVLSANQVVEGCTVRSNSCRGRGVLLTFSEYAHQAAIA